MIGLQDLVTIKLKTELNLVKETRIVILINHS